MVWNSVGSIVSTEYSATNCRIEIRFSNVGGRNKQTAFQDNMGFTMAALSYEGAVFATDPEEEDEEEAAARRAKEIEETGYADPTVRRVTASKVFYYAFPGHIQLGGANENFTVSLTRGEAAVAVACGEGWCAVATSHGFLRVFSSVGLQLALVSLRGPVVTLAGHGAELAVYYHTGPGWATAQAPDHPRTPTPQVPHPTDGPSDSTTISPSRFSPTALPLCG